MGDKRGLDAIEELAEAIDGVSDHFIAISRCNRTGPRQYQKAYLDATTHGSGLAAWLRCAVRDARNEMGRIKSEDGRVKLPVCSDGKPARPGETVWLNGREMRVEGVEFHSGGCSVYVRGVGGQGEADPGDLSHERPDSWEQLEEDARKEGTEYWGCQYIGCDGCRAIVDGMSPAKRYGTFTCARAVGLNLVRRAKALAGVQETHTCGEEGK